MVEKSSIIDPNENGRERERVTFGSGKSMPKWYADALVKAKTAEERRNLRSKTFKGMAKAMAEQWTAE